MHACPSYWVQCATQNRSSADKTFVFKDLAHSSSKSFLVFSISRHLSSNCHHLRSNLATHQTGEGQSVGSVGRCHSTRCTQSRAQAC